MSGSLIVEHCANRTVSTRTAELVPSLMRDRDHTVVRPQHAGRRDRRKRPGDVAAGPAFAVANPRRTLAGADRSMNTSGTLRGGSLEVAPGDVDHLLFGPHVERITRLHERRDCSRDVVCRCPQEKKGLPSGPGAFSGCARSSIRDVALAVCGRPSSPGTGHSSHAAHRRRAFRTRPGISEGRLATATPTASSAARFAA